MMTPKYHLVSNCELNHAQMTAAKYAESELDREGEKSTTSAPSSQGEKTEKTISGFYVETVIVERRAKTLHRKRLTLKPKSTWPDLRPLVENPTTCPSQSQSEEPGNPSLARTQESSKLAGCHQAMLAITDIEFP
jgi:hypothetical protein